MTEDELIKAKIEDKIDQCRNYYYVTSTGFLDSHEQAITEGIVRYAAGVRTLMYGGYDEAERRMLVCIPAGFEVDEDEAVSDLIIILRVEKPAISRPLSHRDYLGSVLGLGIERRLIGDILVREDGADIFIVPDIAEYLLKEYTKAGSTIVKTSIVPAGEAIIPEARAEMISDTVSTLRLDSIISSAFRMSRGRASEAIRRGLVSVDHAECIKPDRKVEEGAILVLKGSGKAVLEEAGGESRKGRCRVKIRKYI